MLLSMENVHLCVGKDQLYADLPESMPENPLSSLNTHYSAVAFPMEFTISQEVCQVIRILSQYGQQIKATAVLIWLLQSSVYIGTS